jgi:plastocyanin
MSRRPACTLACALALAAATGAWSSAPAAPADSPQGTALTVASKARKHGCSTRRTRRARNRCRFLRHCASRRWRSRHKSRAKRCPKRRTAKPKLAPQASPDPGGPSGGTPGGTPPDPVRRVQVQAREFFFTLSRPLVSAGSVKVELVNSGEDPHDLHLRREDGTGAQFAFGSTASQGRQTLTLDLGPGYYYLWCDIAGHEAAGMHARLNVQ